MFRHAALLLVVVLALGCPKSDQVKTSPIKGKVSLDGNPMPEGKIIFDEGPGVPSAEFDVKNGVFEGVAQPGKKTVRFVVNKYGPAPKGMAGQPGYEKGTPYNSLPDRYHSASKEVREIKDGPNEFDFEVKSK